ncbi:MAG: hypothetical protein DMG64_17875 [Acidobacteria bacterium]|nr:MAG: hypothetical protein DMG64_17875 [Acidobacteriota bacterium]
MIPLIRTIRGKQELAVYRAGMEIADVIVVAPQRVGSKASAKGLATARAHGYKPTIVTGGRPDHHFGRR